MKLDDSSSPGISGLPVKILKNIDHLTSPITKIINQCIKTKTIPDEWKSAYVTPIYKEKGEKTELNNYRGISVIPPIAKVFEKIIATQIINYINENRLLTDDQHGFRTSYSCETALHELLTDLNIARDRKLVTLLLFIDFRKAFDLVDPKLLLFKLKLIGFKKNALDLIENYFDGRTQQVIYNNAKSNKTTVRLGVPQGSILGPLLFTIFINDLALSIRNMNKKLFADDTSIYKSMDDKDKIINEFEKSIKTLLEWCDFKKLDLNWSKTFFMFIKNKRINYPTSIRICGIDIKVVDSFQLLGVNIDSKLTFNNFISKTKKSVNCKLYSIKRLFYLSYSVKIQFFKTFIVPYFNYCLTLLIYFPKATIQRLCNLYYLCLFKLFRFKASNDLIDVNIELEKLTIYSFQNLVFSRLGSFFFNILNRHDSPSNLKSLLSKNLTIILVFLSKIFYMFFHVSM